MDGFSSVHENAAITVNGSIISIMLFLMVIFCVIYVSLQSPAFLRV